MPATIMKALRTWPMVNKSATTNPSWGSGSRKNSNPKASGPIQDQKHRCKDSGRPCAAAQGPEYCEQSRSFQQKFIELRRVARKRPSVREDHAPGRIRHASEQLTVDEIADPAQAKTDGRSD